MFARLFVKNKSFILLVYITQRRFNIGKIDGEVHQNMVKEPHLVVLQEPNSKLLGNLKVNAENALTKHTRLCEFFSEKGFELGICSYGENTNTGVENGINGIIWRFEIKLERPLHWSI